MVSDIGVSCVVSLLFVLLSGNLSQDNWSFIEILKELDLIRSIFTTARLGWFPTGLNPCLVV